MSLDLRREPLLLRTLLTAIVTAIVHLAVLQGWVSVEAASPESVAALVDAVGVVVAAFWARQAVTPAHDPVIQETVTTRLSNVESPDWGELTNVSDPEPTTYPETVDNL